MKKTLALLLAVVMLFGTVMALTSCGQDLNFGKEFKPAKDQVTVLFELNANTIDVGVMDSIMAGYYMSQDTTYANALTIVKDLTLAEEQYGIAARKGSGLAKKINAALVELAKDGTMQAIGEKYGVASEICIDTTYVAPELTADELVDWNYIQANGKIIVGYTDFAPISWEKDGELVGFDVELAKAVGTKLGLEIEFKLIEWSAKEGLLSAKTIDCIWNGMTITPERQAAMEISIPYLYNKQVAVIRKADADKYTTTESMADAIIGAEGGSAGEGCVVAE